MGHYKQHEKVLPQFIEKEDVSFHTYCFIISKNTFEYYIDIYIQHNISNPKGSLSNTNICSSSHKNITYYTVIKSTSHVSFTKMVTNNCFKLYCRAVKYMTFLYMRCHQCAFEWFFNIQCLDKIAINFIIISPFA